VFTIKLFYFEEKRVAALPGVAIKIQACWRGYIARSKFGKRKAITKIMEAYRSWKVSVTFLYFDLM
jgi:hypothetical protein